MYKDFGIFSEGEIDLKALNTTKRKLYKLKTLEMFFKINGEAFPYTTIYENTNSHKFEAINGHLKIDIFEAINGHLKIDIFDFKNTLDNFGDLYFWEIQRKYNRILDDVETYIRKTFEYVFSREIVNGHFKYDLPEKIKGNADVNIHLLRFDITLRVDNTDKIIRRWFTVHKGYFAGHPNEVLKIDSDYAELNIMLINEINNLMINDDKNAALLVDTLMEDWRSHHR